MIIERNEFMGLIEHLLKYVIHTNSLNDIEVFDRAWNFETDI